MMRTEFLSSMTSLVRPLRAAMLLVSACLLVACGGGGEVVVPPPSSAVSISSPRPLPAEFMARKAVNYSPFRSGNRDTEVITPAMVKEDLELLLLGNFRLIRLFDSSDAVSRVILQVIKDNGFDIKVQLGAYTNSESSPYLSDVQKQANAVGNRAEVARTVVMANEFRDIVLAVSIGNETMVSWSFVPTDPLIMAAYIRSVRGQITQPITTDDNWAFFASAPKVITDAIDFASVHTYSELDSVFAASLFDWKQQAVAPAGRAAAMMDAMMAKTRSDVAAARGKLDRIGLSAMPITIGETGWNAVNVGALRFRAHPVNQKLYFQALEAWALAARTGSGPANIFYFEAFDEPWKGNDDKWGLFNVGRQARFVIQNLNPPGTVSGSATWNYEPVNAVVNPPFNFADLNGVYTTSDALFFVPLAANPVVTEQRYTAFANTAAAVTERNATATVAFNAFGGTTTLVPLKAGAASPGDGGTGVEITPGPASYGWGVVLNLLDATKAEDLSNFAGGTLNFSIQTSYPGKIEIGFSTGSSATTDSFEVWMPIGPGQYGYNNDGAWHNVSIPIADLIPFGVAGFGMNGSPDAVLDLRKVTLPFVIVDRYDRTGKDQNSGITTKINVDAIFWLRP